MFLKNKDYTVWTKKASGENGEDEYFIMYHGQTESPVCKICVELFVLYLGEFHKPLENQRNERRRHMENESLGDVDKSGKLASDTLTDEEMLLTLCAIEAALKTCTPLQQKRFKAHYQDGYTMTEIAEMDGCDLAAVSRSIAAAMKKVKKYFLG